MIKVQILVSKWCPVCPQAEAVWKQAAEKVPMELQVLDVADREGREIVSNLRIKTVPAIVVDGALKTVGAQPLGEVLKMLGAQ
ncbi:MULTISPECIES: thioredoxin family protein [unclassified Acidithiobacillus]|uniref:thioredoxin family protein n=1 Tax=unclassified Acidithiobacillus TaxID=2614800 RepID=UPI001D0D0B71|nr:MULTISPECIES: thioredoxin family protein [unclassified Acidithiobacillus]